MPDHAQEHHHRFEVFDYSDRGLDWFDRGPGFPDDALLRIAYTISEWVITFVGPMFWVCLAYLFLVAQLAH
jgi:hypothetical protein